MRLLSTIFTSIFIAVVTIYGLRTFGLSQDHLQRKHEFLDHGPRLFSLMGDRNLPNYPSLNNMAETKNRVSGNMGWALPIYVVGEKLVAKTEYNTLDLEPIIAAFPNDYYFFHIMENVETINYLLNELIKKYSLENKILLFSPFRNVIAQFRTLRPQWLTAMSTPEASLFYLSHKAWLETLAPFPADFLWLSTNDEIWLRELSTSEVERRKKFMICDKSLQLVNCMAYVTDSPTKSSADQTSSSNAAGPNN
jgi:hypothetical protein